MCSKPPVSEMDEKLLHKIAQAIWNGGGSVPRLLTEISKPDSELNRQQSKCWNQARAVYIALFN